MSTWNTNQAAGSDHYPANLQWRDGGYDTFGACGAAWPCLFRVHTSTQRSSLPVAKIGSLCPSCGVMTGLRMRGHKGKPVCLECDEDWLTLPSPSVCRVLWDDDDLFLNNLWVGSVQCCGADGTYRSWLRGRGHDEGGHRTRPDAEAALIERAVAEISIYNA